MIKSMTGYGRGENTAFQRKFTVEMKAVNHRYCDISIKLPRSLNQWEDQIRKRLMQSVFRGKTDVYIQLETFATEDFCVKLNEPLAEAYIAKLHELEDRFTLTTNDTLGLVARFPEMITLDKTQNDEGILWETLQPALEEALERFLNMRSMEGEALKKDILEKGSHILTLLDAVKERAPFVVTEYKAKLEKRLKELAEGIDVDPQRLAMEVAVFADKSCIDEELTRLDSHLRQLRKIFDLGGQVGRKLDFLVQEMNREVNTIASKANDITITQITIDLKSEIEKIREQIQNIE